MRMPAFVTASFAFAIAHAQAPAPPIRFAPDAALSNLHAQALGAIADGTTDAFAKRWGSRAPVRFAHNGADYYFLPCADARDQARPLDPHNQLEPGRVPRVLSPVAPIDRER